MALGEKCFGTARAFNALGDLSEIHASGEIRQALCGEDHGANRIIGEHLG